jgi:uncharacterized protein HemX
MPDDPRSEQEHPQGPDATSPPAAANGRTDQARAGGAPPGGDVPSDLPAVAAAPRGKRHTALIALCALLAIAVVGLAVWGANQKSNADDAQAKVEAQQKAASSATSAGDDIKSAFDKAAAQIGANSDAIDEIQQQIDAAKAKVDAADQQRQQASGVIDTAKAELASFKAKAEQASTCLKGSLNALGAAIDAGGAEAAVQELQQIAGSCASAAAAQ